MFSSGLCRSFFAFADPSSPFAFGRNCEIFASVPKSYWDSILPSHRAY